MAKDFREYLALCRTVMCPQLCIINYELCIHEIGNELLFCLTLQGFGGFQSQRRQFN